MTWSSTCAPFPFWIQCRFSLSYTAVGDPSEHPTCSYPPFPDYYDPLNHHSTWFILGPQAAPRLTHRSRHLNLTPIRSGEINKYHSFFELISFFFITFLWSRYLEEFKCQKLINFIGFPLCVTCWMFFDQSPIHLTTIDWVPWLWGDVNIKNKQTNNNKKNTTRLCPTLWNSWCSWREIH